MEINTELVYKILAKNIKDIRLKKNWSVEKLSDLSSVDKTHIYRIEAGQKKVGLGVLIKISYALEVNVGDLFVIPTEITQTIQYLDHSNNNALEYERNINRNYSRRKCLEKLLILLKYSSDDELERLSKKLLSI